MSTKTSQIANFTKEKRNATCGELEPLCLFEVQIKTNNEPHLTSPNMLYDPRLNYTRLNSAIQSGKDTFVMRAILVGLTWLRNLHGLI